MRAETRPSISAFFPGYNDSGTIASWSSGVQDGARLTADFEVIVVNDGSADATAEILDELARKYPARRHHETNRGYGGALRSGFATATKELIFYTDGDAQMRRRRDGGLLWAADRRPRLVNGYKISRSDPLHRIFIGHLHRYLTR